MDKDKKNEEIIDSYDYLANAASTQDCTGLIPALATSKAERESYANIYHYLPATLDIEEEDAEQPPK